MKRGSAGSVGGTGREVKRQRQEAAVSGLDIDEQLRRLRGEGATWRSEEQREGMVKVIGVWPGSALVVVLPTGGGQCVLFMAPAAIAGSCTSIVVVPFVALADDVAARARGLGTDCLHWRGGRRGADDRQGDKQSDSRLVVVSADEAGSNGFANYTENTLTRRHLRRIFVDECHTVVTDAGYRPKLEGLWGLHRHGWPVVITRKTIIKEFTGCSGCKCRSRWLGAVTLMELRMEIRLLCGPDPPRGGTISELLTYTTR